MRHGVAPLQFLNCGNQQKEDDEMKLNIRKDASQRKKIMKSIISSICWILDKALNIFFSIMGIGATMCLLSPEYTRTLYECDHKIKQVIGSVLSVSLVFSLVLFILKLLHLQIIEE